MGDLTPRQRSELRYLARSERPLWGGVPPGNADRDLAIYIERGYVIWVGRGYRITPAGRAALSNPPGDAR